MDGDSTLYLAHGSTYIMLHICQNLKAYSVKNVFYCIYTVLYILRSSHLTSSHICNFDTYNVKHMSTAIINGHNR